MRDLRLQNREARRRASRGRRRAFRSTLAALTSAALSLFSHAGPVAANSPVDEFGVGFSYSRYDEDDIPLVKLAFGSPKRYTIDTYQVSGEGPITERIDAGFDFIYESMSGATPWYVVPDQGTGEPLQAMTAATIHEQRYDASGYGNLYFDTGRLGARLGGSTENDYQAVYMGFNGEKNINDKNTDLNLSLSFSIDRLEPVGGGNDNIEEARKNSVTLYAGFNQIIGRNTIMQAGMNYKYSSGFLSDPYKKAFIDETNIGGSGYTVPDSRPDERNQIALSLRLRHHIERLNASIHGDYRYGWDDWDLISQTFQLSWFQNVFDDLIQIIPNFRYYSQSQAYFYRAYYTAPRADGLASSDYRLAPFGAMSGGVRTQLRMEDWPWGLDWRVGFSYERYVADADYALGSVETENPGLVQYNLFYATLELRF